LGLEAVKLRDTHLTGASAVELTSPAPPFFLLASSRDLVSLLALAARTSLHPGCVARACDSCSIALRGVAISFAPMTEWVVVPPLTRHAGSNVRRSLDRNHGAEHVHGQVGSFFVAICAGGQMRAVLLEMCVGFRVFVGHKPVRPYQRALRSWSWALV
jgi:hypothetical protein